MRKPEVIRAPAELTFGRYSLVEPIAKGGMAEVWRAKLVGAENFERSMVIKRILPHLCDDPEFVRLFVAEARLSARLNHPNIVQVFELGDVDGELFMALEMVVGVDLRTLLRAHDGPLPPGLCAMIAHEICRALAYAHGVTDESGKPLSIVHRDVSPSNVLIGYDGQVRLCDFGIAKALGVASKERTRTGSIKGKVGYLAPEFVEGAPFDHRADLFAVGILCYEMLSGRRLFKADDDLHTLQLVRACEIPSLSAQEPNIPPALEALTRRALSRDPDDRWQQADEMVAALAPIIHDLRWGARETVAVVRGAVPESDDPPEPSMATRSAAPVASASRPHAASRPQSATRYVGKPKPRPRRWPLPVGVAALLSLTALVLVMRGSSPVKDALPHPQAVASPPIVTPLPMASAASTASAVSTVNAAPADPAPALAAPANAAPANAAPANAAQPSVATAPVAAPPAAAGLPEPPSLTPPSASRASRAIERPHVSERRHKSEPPPHKKHPTKAFDLERGDVLDSL